MSLKKAFILLLVITVPGFIIVSGKKGSENFISRKMIEKTTEIEISTGNDSFLLKKEKDEWRLVSQGLRIKCRQEMVSTFLDILSGIKVEETAGENGEVWNDLGVGGDSLLFTILKGDGTSEKIIWGKRTFGGRRIFARKEDDYKTIVTGYPGSFIYTGRWNWVPMNLFPEGINTDNILKISLTREDSIYTLVRKSGWVLISKYGEADIDREKSEALISRIVNCSGESIESGKNYMDLKKEGAVVLYMSDGYEYRLEFYKDKEALYVINIEKGRLFRTNPAQMNAVLPELKYIINNF